MLVKLCSAVLLMVSCALAQRPVLWRDPGNIEYLDLHGGAGGRANAPRGPFSLVRSDDSGTSPKLLVRDVRGRLWTAKFGPEVKAETFASRLVWAAGYYVEPVYYVRSGRISGARDLGRAGRHVSERGYFRDARFELRNTEAGRYLPQYDWTWKKNAFLGTHQLNGLKILVMLTSNWDNKDGRDDTSNTAIFERGTPAGREWVYMVTDWGGSMGKWGNFFTREKWDCHGFREQTGEFVGFEDSRLKFGFTGKHDDDFKADITPADARWLLRYLGRISDSQIRSALRASGATPHETDCFTRSLRSRINQLRRVSQPKAVSPDLLSRRRSS